MEQIGRYEITGELGRGAMGVVYRATDPNIGRDLAIKTIKVGEGRNAQEQARLRERLFREARSAGSLSHPGIVTVYDVNQQDDLAYIAMEFVDGTTLDERMSRPEPISPREMLGILGQMAGALDYAHSKGIVHRDVKPANVMIARDGTVKIADFGIAKITSSDQLTMTGAIVGTPHYMSPEQVQGKTVDGRSDEFSLGVIAYEMLSGEQPFAGEQLTTVVFKIVSEEPAPVVRFNPSLSPRVDLVLRRVLAKRADQRYRTCTEFVDALELACSATPGWMTMTRGGSLSAPTSVDIPKPALPPPARTRGQAAPEPPPRRAGFGTFLVGILLAAAMLALIAWQVGPWWAEQQNSAARAVEPPDAPLPPPAPVTSPTPTPTPAIDQPRPSALGESAPPVTTPSAARRAVPVTVISSPAGVSVTMDGQPEVRCQTPCTVEAPPGRHAFTLALDGYQTEQRETTVADAPVELPLVTMQVTGGTLMLSSVPAGAAIQIDGKRVRQITPAQITLAPGPHTVIVEKDGRQMTKMVEIHAGSVNYEKVSLQ